MKNWWRWLIAINLGILVIGVLMKVVNDVPNLTYIHLLVDYHFGFIKRALIGELLSLFMDKVPPSAVFALGSAIIAVTLLLYLRLFQNTFRFSEASLPLFVFIAGSPFFFKNFVKTIGYFDVYGCALAIVLLLVPTTSFGFVVLAATGSMVLILVHHLHTLLYVPTIAAIVIVRFFLVRRPTKFELVVSAVLAVTIAAEFFLMQVGGVVRATPEEFRNYLLSRMTDGGLATEAISNYLVWFRSASEEITTTLGELPANLSVSWFYVLLVVLHAPVVRYFRNSISALASQEHRRIVVALLVAISLCHLVIFAVVYDYSRWVSAWAVCMILMLHAIKQLPVTQTVPLIAPDDKTAFRLAAVLTLIPRVGIVRPF